MKNTCRGIIPARSILALLATLCLLLTHTSTLAQSTRPALDRTAIRTPWTTELQQQWLHQVMPQAETFTEKSGQPPVFRGYRQDPANGTQELLGYVFFSADIPPEEIGYSAPIAMLIGLLTDGTLSGIKVLTYYESYAYSRGDFVADVPFQSQFPGKAIVDEFRLNRDIDGLSNATLTSFAITRGVREAARKVAAAYLDFAAGNQQEVTWGENALEQLQQLSWQDLLEQGIVRQFSMPMPVDTVLELSIAYMGRPALGEYFIGAEDYARAERDASRRLGGREMILVAVGGSAAPLFRQHLLSFQQGDNEPQRIQPRRFVTAGNADAGVFAGRASYAGAIVMAEDWDPTQAFQLFYQPPGSPEPYGIDYTLSGVSLNLAQGEPVLSRAEIEAAMLAEAPLLTRLRLDPPWGDTPGYQLFMLLLLLTLVMTAFLRKNSAVRWAALTVTLFYLGFYQNGFLSVSHITNAMTQGPGIFLNNLPMLIIIVFTLVTTLIWGRLFCSSLCPFGALQDFLTRFRPRHWQLPKRWQMQASTKIHQQALYIKYGILALILGTALVNSNLSIFQYFEPFGTLFFFSPSPLLWSILLLLLLACVLIERFYCRYVCPLGAALAILSLLSPARIKRVPQCTLCTVCEHACPTGAIRREQIDFKECVRCDICESKLINKAGTCRHPVGDIIARHRELGSRLGAQEPGLQAAVKLAHSSNQG
ncbi:MAG: 4Fe-4S binding protein [Pseudomonadales bacterium]|nr:4Fe-4S binding protein [Pseudomonadales bacterium]